MPPWAIKKKQKTEEEKQIISKTVFYESLCISLLETFFNKYNVILIKTDKIPSYVVSFDENTQRLQELVNQGFSSCDTFIINDGGDTNNKYIAVSHSIKRQNYRYYLRFNSTAFLTCDSIFMTSNFSNLFIVYRLNSQSTPLISMVNTNVLFRDTTQQITFSNGSLLIGGAIDDYIVIGSYKIGGKEITAPFQNKANAAEVKKWCCLSVHWNLIEKSSVWCNGKKLTNFSSRRIARGTSFAPFAIGALRKYNSENKKVYVFANKFSGYIALFSYNNKRMTDDEIKLHHHVFCKHWYNIDHDPIIFD